MGRRLLGMALVCATFYFANGCCACGGGPWRSPLNPRMHCDSDHCSDGGCSTCGMGLGGCGMGGCGASDDCGCSSCGGCGSCYSGPISWAFSLFNRNTFEGPVCGERYWGEWYSDPVDCCDPCDRCGNFTGGVAGRGCGCAGGAPSGNYVDGPAANNGVVHSNSRAPQAVARRPAQAQPTVTGKTAAAPSYGRSSYVVGQHRQVVRQHPSVVAGEEYAVGSPESPVAGQTYIVGQHEYTVDPSWAQKLAESDDTLHDYRFRPQVLSVTDRALSPSETPESVEGESSIASTAAAPASPAIRRTAQTISTTRRY